MTDRPGQHRLLLITTGLGGGFFSGLTGVGGGAIMVPLMAGPLRMRQHAAHGTSLVIIIFAAIAGAAVYEVREGIDWGLVLALLPASLVGAYLGARGVQLLPALRLRQVFGAFILLIGIRLLAVPDIDPFFTAQGATEILTSTGIGLAGGIVAGALGVGGGAIFVPALVLLLGIDQHVAQGVSLCVIAPAALTGALTHARHGSIDRKAASWIAPLAVPAGMGGALVASWLNGDVLRIIFAGVLVGVGSQMLATATLRIRRAQAHGAPGAAPA